MSTPETLTLSADARFKLRETLRGIPGSHEQWADIQDVLDTDAVAVDELLNILAAIGAAVRTIVATTDRELAQLRREHDAVRTGTVNAGRAQQIQPINSTHATPIHQDKEKTR